MPKPPLHARWLALGMIRALRTQIRPFAKPDNAGWAVSWVAGQLNVRPADVRFWLDMYDWNSSEEMAGVVGQAKRSVGIVGPGKPVTEWREVGGRAEDVLPAGGGWVPSWAAAAEAVESAGSGSGEVVRSSSDSDLTPSNASFSEALSSEASSSSTDSSSAACSATTTTAHPSSSLSTPSTSTPSSSTPSPSTSIPTTPSPTPTPSQTLTIYKPNKLERRRRAALQDHEKHPSLRWQAVGMQRALEAHLPLIARMEGFDYVISDALGVRRKTVKDWVTEYYETGTVDPDVVTAIPEGRERPLVERKRGFYEV